MPDTGLPPGEREACAQLVEQYRMRNLSAPTALQRHIADLIRQRGVGGD